MLWRFGLLVHRGEIILEWKIRKTFQGFTHGYMVIGFWVLGTGFAIWFAILFVVEAVDGTDGESA